MHRTGKARKIVYELKEGNLFILGILQLIEKGEGTGHEGKYWVNRIIVTAMFVMS